MSDDVRYELDYWRDALEAAEFRDWCPTDSLEKHGPLAQWLCNEVIDHEKVDRNREVVEAAFDALKGKGEVEFGPERLMTVILSYRGDTVDDWRTLAEEHAEENGAELVFLGGRASEEEYRRWYLARQPEGEVYVPTSAGGTLYWFDSNKW